MPKIRLTKIFEFEMAHALWNYDGKCKNIHGHTFKLEVTVIGEPINDPGSPKNGMVIDFGDLKKIIKQHIVDKHDHYLTINQNSPHNNLDYENAGFELINRKNYQPTSENLVIEFVDIIKKQLPKNIKLLSVKLWETANSYAEWNALDNE